jgi:hypothetical protein
MKLGQLAKDKVTGFEGTIVGHADYLSGCDQYLLVPTVDEKGNHREGHWFDEQRLVVINENVLSYERKKPGADGSAPKK